MRVFLLASALGVSCSLFGCAAQLKSAMVEHAKATGAVAATLTRATAAIQCEGSKNMESCTAAVSTINDQAKALQESADSLERAGK